MNKNGTKQKREFQYGIKNFRLKILNSRQVVSFEFPLTVVFKFDKESCDFSVQTKIPFNPFFPFVNAIIIL